MRLNNKGFAVSIVLYSMAAIIVIILLLILGVNAANVHNQENTSDKTKEEVSNIGVE